MNDEIKEILDKLEIVARKHTIEVCEDGSKIKTMPASVVDELRLNNYSAKLLYNYITNLQQQLHQASLDIQELTERDIGCPSWCDKLTNLQQEKPHLHTNTEWEDLLDYKGRTYIELERFKQVKQENERLKEEKQLIESDINNSYSWLEDYKSRCEKAIEYINKNKHLSMFADCREPKEDWNYDLECSANDLLNILQNGSGDK